MLIKYLIDWKKRGVLVKMSKKKAKASKKRRYPKLSLLKKEAAKEAKSEQISDIEGEGVSAPFIAEQDILRKAVEGNKLVTSAYNELLSKFRQNKEKEEQFKNSLIELNSKLNSAMQELQEKNSRVGQLNDRLNKEGLIISKLQENIKSLTAEFQRKQKDAVEPVKKELFLQKPAEEPVPDFKDVKELSGLKSEFYTQLKLNKQLRDKNRFLQGNMEEQEKRFAQLFYEKNKEIHKLELDVERLRNGLLEFDRKSNELVNEDKIKIIELENQLQEKEKAVQDAYALIHSLKNRARMEDIEVAQKIAAEKINEAGLLRKTLDEREAELKHVKEINSAYAQKVLLEAQKNKNYAIEKDALKDELSKLREAALLRLEENKKLRIEVEKLKTFKAGMDEKSSWLQNTIDSKNKEIELLREKLLKTEELSKVEDKGNKELLEKIGLLEKNNSELTAQLERLGQELKKKDQYYPYLLKMEKMEEEDKLKTLTREALRRETAMRIEIDRLKEVIKEKEEQISKLRHSEREMILGLHKKLRSAFADYASVLIETPKVLGFEKELSEKGSKEVDELMPVLKNAFEQNASVDSIKQSLMNAGYSEKAISEAIRRYNK